MKKLGILLGALGLFALVGVASASPADTLQPAQTITYDEEVVVNDTLRTDSIVIGSAEAGVGGVTFFNGSIVNNSVDEDGASTIAVTLADDVRIDGLIYRTEIGGDDPLKLADTIRPQPTATYDLGTTTNEFRSAYFSGTVNTAALSAETLALTGALTGTTATLTGALTGTTATLTGALTGTTATLTGALTGTTAAFSGDVAASGDINQDIADNGAVKAMVEMDGSVAAEGDCLVKSWTIDDTVPTCAKAVAGSILTLTFDSGIDVDARYYTATSTTTSLTRAVSAVATDNVVRFYPYDEDGNEADTDIMFVVY
ncbi:MAG: hypothetical protein HQ530_00245 [Parcubacteria group bacterium]|nr:hypothetical protein [Parcubacteria group bacterium]